MSLLKNDFMTEQYRKTPRASFLDYENGQYFITICTRNKKHFFGTIRDGKMILSHIGKFVELQLNRCSEFYPDMEMQLFVVMPNHIHFIISTNGNRDCNAAEQRSPNSALRANPDCHRFVPALSR